MEKDDKNNPITAYHLSYDLMPENEIALLLIEY
jgi:hypothetical protein